MTSEASGLPSVPIRCFVYGVPAVISAELSKAAEGLITTFVFRNDIFSRLSLGLIRDFRNVTINFCTEVGIAEGVIGKALGTFKDSVTGKPEGIEDDLWYWALLKTLKADMNAEKLYPPGKVYWINSPHSAHEPRFGQGNGKTAHVQLDLVDDIELSFGEILFSTTMFTDHSPHHYEGSLELLADALCHE